MATHELKTDPELFDAVARGDKTHQIRRNDRGFAVGDELVLRRTEWTGEQMRAGAPLIYSDVPPRRRIVTHVLDGYGLQDGWVILSLAFLAAPRCEDEGMRAAMVKLSGALGHPAVITTGADQCIEAALIELAADRLRGDVTPRDVVDSSANPDAPASAGGISKGAPDA